MTFSVRVTATDGEWMLEYDGTDPAELDEAERALLVFYTRGTTDPDFIDELLQWAIDKQRSKKESIH